MKKGMLIWIVAGVLLVAGTVFWGMQNIILCWDGIEVNEPLLIEQCGITEEEYYSGGLMDEGGCPQESGAVQFVGSCDPEWLSISTLAAGVGLGYLAVSGVVFGIRKLVRKS